MIPRKYLYHLHVSRATDNDGTDSITAAVFAHTPAAALLAAHRGLCPPANLEIELHDPARQWCVARPHSQWVRFVDTITRQWAHGLVCRAGYPWDELNARRAEVGLAPLTERDV